MSELQGIARFKFHEGKLEEFKRLEKDDQVEATSSPGGGTHVTFTRAGLWTASVENPAARGGAREPPPDRGRFSPTQIRVGAVGDVLRLTLVELGGIEPPEGVR